MGKGLRNYLSTGIWRIQLRQVPPLNAFFIRQLRIAVLTARKTIKDDAGLLAPVLSFFSVFAIGPLVALILGIAKGFGIKERLETEILTKIPAQEEILQQIIGHAQALLQNTHGDLIAGVGIVVLLLSAIKVFFLLEHAFDVIWHVKNKRSWKKTISVYLAFLLLAPLFILFYSSLPAFVISRLDEFSSQSALLAKVSPLIIDLLQLSPFLLAWALFSLVYVLIPNTRVKPLPVITAGVLTGTVYLLIQWAMVEFQVGITKYNPIYGSLIALPLLLMWINIGWLSLLIGAEYAYASQNVDLYEFEPDFTDISLHFKKVLTLQLLRRLALRFSMGEKPLSAGQISEQLHIPLRLTQQIIGELAAAGLVSSTNVDQNHDPAYQPSSDIHRWTIKFVTDALEQRGTNRHPLTETDTLRTIEKALAELGAAVEGSEANRGLLKI
ncbi:MAG: YhjD/YihY/BrkB family envelope integrity protein [Desulfobacterales bacterium]